MTKIESSEYATLKSSRVKNAARVVCREIFFMVLLSVCLCYLVLSGLTQAVLADELEASNSRPLSVVTGTVEPLAVLQFDIPRQRADGALTALGQQADITVVYRLDWVKPFYTNGLKGNHTLPEAVEILLVDTGLTARLDSKGHLIISQKNGRERESMNFKKMNSKKKLLAATIGFFVGTGTQGVLAQESATAEDEAWLLEEVVVTASRREEKLQDVAMSVSAVGPEEFTSVGLTKLSDVIEYMPGVTLTDSSGRPVGGEITIRGVGQQAGTTSTVGIYVDDTPLTSNGPFGLGAIGSFSFDGLLGDVERVEFLKGPQGTLYGSTSLGGAVRYITKKPSLDDLRGALSMDISSKKNGGLNKVYSGRISAPIIKDRLGFTISGFYNDDDGFVDRVDRDGVLIEKDADFLEQTGIAGDLFYRISDAASFRLRALHQKAEYNGLSFVDLNPFDRSYLYKGLSNSSAFADEVLEKNLYSSVFEYHFSGFSLTAVSSYVQDEYAAEKDLLGNLSDFFDDRIGRPRGTTTSLDANVDFGSDIYTQEIRFTSNNDHRFEWMVGLYYADEETFGVQSTTIQPGSFNWFTSSEPSEYQEYASFANLTYFFTEEFDITLGSRFSRNEMKLSQEVSSDFVSLGEPSSSIEKDTVDTWSFEARYRPDEDVSFYARVASGYRPASSNRSAPGLPEKVEQDNLWSYELGAKGQLVPDFLSYDMALWQINWDDFQAVVSVPGFSGLANVSGGVTARGFEVSTKASLIADLILEASLAYTESTLNKNEEVLQGSKGQQMPYVPKWTASVRADYEYALSSSIDGSVGLGFRYVDSARSGFTDSNSFIPNVSPEDGNYNPKFNFPTDSYLVADINAGISWENLTANLYVTNLLDEKALTGTGGSYFGASAISATGVPINPRTFGLFLSADF